MQMIGENRFMKNYISSISSLITVLIFIIGKVVLDKINHTVQLSYDGTKMLYAQVLFFFIIGMFISWNLWLLYRDKNVFVNIVISLVMTIAVMLVYFHKFQELFFYPAILTGSYISILIIKIFMREEQNQ